MKKIYSTIFLTLLLGFQVISAPIYNLYNAHRAMRVDDILTVIIVESANGGSQSGTNTQKQNDMSVSGANGSGLLKFLPSLGASGSSKVDYSGQGAQLAKEAWLRKYPRELQGWTMEILLLMEAKSLKLMKKRK